MRGSGGWCRRPAPRRGHRCRARRAAQGAGDLGCRAAPGCHCPHHDLSRSGRRASDGPGLRTRLLTALIVTFVVFVDRRPLRRSRRAGAPRAPDAGLALSAARRRGTQRRGGAGPGRRCHRGRARRLAAAARGPGRGGRAADRRRCRGDRGQPAPDPEPGRPAAATRELLAASLAALPPEAAALRARLAAALAESGPDATLARRSSARHRSCCLRLRPGSGAGQRRRGARLDRRIRLSAAHRRGRRCRRGGVRSRTA